MGKRENMGIPAKTLLTRTPPFRREDTQTEEDSSNNYDIYTI
jgi:hypothetical protein